MFTKYFDIHSLGKYSSRDVLVRCIHKFRFKSPKNTYIVDVEEYDEHLYVLKFYLKNHRLSEKKYKLKSKEYVANEVLGTCLEIGKYIYQKDNMASFGFVGVNDEGEPMEETKRYRIYSGIAIRVFDAGAFDHCNDVNNSLYFILNKKNNNINKDTISKQMTHFYNNIFLQP